MKQSLKDLLCKPYVILDGATGSNLIASGMPSGVCVEKWITENPDVIIKLQKSYVDAGSDIVYAPTFGAIRKKLEEYGLGDNTVALNEKLVSLSKEAVGNDVLIAGDVSTSTLFVSPVGDASFDDILNVYREQIGALKKAGVDLVVTETQMSLADVRASVLVCNEFSMPVIATITVNENGKTIFGMGLKNAIIILQSLGALAVGLNCSAGPDRMVKYIEEAKSVAKVPIIAKPNAGEPGNALSPEDFASSASKLFEAGATILGGCCGTTPEHICALKKAVENIDSPILDKSCDCCVANERAVHILDIDTITLSEPIVCSEDLADDLLDFDIDDADVIVIELNGEEDINTVKESISFAPCAVGFTSTSTELLDKMLKEYQGRAVVVYNINNDRCLFEQIADKYGALII